MHRMRHTSARRTTTTGAAGRSTTRRRGPAVGVRPQASALGAVRPECAGSGRYGVSAGRRPGAGHRVSPAGSAEHSTGRPGRPASISPVTCRPRGRSSCVGWRGGRSCTATPAQQAETTPCLPKASSAVAEAVWGMRGGSGTRRRAPPRRWRRTPESPRQLTEGAPCGVAQRVLLEQSHQVVRGDDSHEAPAVDDQDPHRGLRVHP